MANYPAWLGQMVKWITTGTGTERWRDATATPLGGCLHDCEGGVDLGAPVGTPVYALADGPLLAVQHSIAPHPGGVVSQRVTVPGAGTQDIYYQHIDPTLPECSWGNCSNVIVKAGQQIGTVGTAGETEVGFNAGWGGVWGGGKHPPGTSWNGDPRPWIAALMTGSGGYTGTSGDTNTTGSTPAPTVQPANLQGFATKAGLFIAALVLVGFGAYLTFEKQSNAVLGKVKKAVEVGALA